MVQLIFSFVIFKPYISNLKTVLIFILQNYQTITSPPVYISPLDLGPKYTNKSGAEFQEYRKIYGENYCLGQLIFWHNQSNADPDRSLARASRGCLSLPDTSSFYAKAQKPSRHCVYGPRTVRSMLARMVSFFYHDIFFKLFCYCAFIIDASQVTASTALIPSHAVHRKPLLHNCHVLSLAIICFYELQSDSNPLSRFFNSVRNDVLKA